MYEPIMTNASKGIRLYQFANGYGASVKRERTRSDRFELAVVGSDWDITYDTPGPNGVYRFETAESVQELLARIDALPAIAESIG